MIIIKKFRYLIFTIIWTLLALIISFVIGKITTFNLNDILFIIGLLFVIIGGMSSLGGDSRGLSLQGLGSNNVQQVNNANLEINKMINEKSSYSINNEILLSLSNGTLIFGGILTILISLIVM